MIEIVVTYSKGLFGIARYFDHKWTHAALVFDHSTVIETNSQGCIKRSWEEFIKGVDEYETYALKQKLYLSEREVIRAFAEGNVGKAYHYLQLLRIIWQILFKQRRPLAQLIGANNVCSSFVHTCFKYIGIDLVPNLPPTWYALPDDLINSSLVVKTGGNV